MLGLTGNDLGGYKANGVAITQFIRALVRRSFQMPAQKALLGGMGSGLGSRANLQQGRSFFVSQPAEQLVLADFHGQHVRGILWERWYLCLGFVKEIFRRLILSFSEQHHCAVKSGWTLDELSHSGCQSPVSASSSARRNAVSAAL